MARSKKACIIFFDEVDAISGDRFDDGEGGDNEVQRTMLEIVNQLDGPHGYKQIHSRTMNCERDIRFEMLAQLCPNATGADVRSVCTETGMYAIKGRRKTVTVLDAVDKVIKGYQKFSATPKYMVYN